MAVEKGPATEIAAESAPPPKSKKKLLDSFSSTFF
jgi:hypothetical protein